MPDGVQVPVSLEFTDVNLGNVDKITKSVEKQMSGLSRSINDIFSSTSISRFSDTARGALSNVQTAQQAVLDTQGDINKVLTQTVAGMSQYRKSMSEFLKYRNQLMEFEQVFGETLESMEWFKRESEAIGKPELFDEFRSDYQELKTLQAEILQQFEQARSKAQPVDYMQSGSPENMRALLQLVNELLSKYGELREASQEYNATIVRTGEYQTQINEVGNLTTSLGSLIDKAREMESIPGTTERAWVKLEAQATPIIQKLKDTLSEMWTRLEAGKGGAFTQLIDESTAEHELTLFNQLKDAATNLIAVLTSKINTNTSAYTTEYEVQLRILDQVERKLNEVIEKYNRMIATGRMTPQGLRDMEYDLNHVAGEAESASASLIEMVNTGRAFKIGRGDASIELENIRSRAEAVTQNISETSDRGAEAAETFKRMSDGASVVAGAFGGVLSKIVAFGKVAVNVFNRVKSSISKIVRGIKSLVSGIKKAISSMRVFHKSGSKGASDMAAKFNKLKRAVLMYGLGFRTAYFAIKRLRRTFTDAFKTMAAQFPQLNAQLNSFTMALNRLKGSLGTMFQPLISVAIPVLVRFMEYLSRAMELLGSFFAVLTGQKVIYRATSNQEDYAASLNDTADAAKAAKEALASYDKLDVIQKDNGGAGSGGNGTDLPLNVTYEPVDINRAISEFAEMIKAAWEAQDFTDVGKYLTAKALSILDYVQENIVPKITGFINRLANVIVTFVDSFDFKQVGNKIGEIISDIVRQLDAHRIGEALASIYNMFIRFFDGLVTGIRWSELPAKIMAFIDGFIKKLDSRTAIHAISTFVNNLANVIIDVVKDPKWQEYGEQFANTIDDLFAAIEWDKVGKAAGGLIGGLLRFFATVLQNIEWKDLKDDIDQFLTSFVTEITAALDELNLEDAGQKFASLLFRIWDAVKPLVSQLVEGALEFIWGVLEVAASQLLVRHLAQKVGEFFIVGVELVTGLLNGISNKLLTIYTWIRDNVFNPIIKAICKLFKIDSPSKVLEDIGVYLIDGLLKGLKDTWKKITGFFSEQWGKLKTDIQDTWDSICNLVSEKVETLKTNIQDKFTDIKNKVAEIWDSVKTKTSEIWEDVKNVIKNPINGILGFIERLVNGIVDGINTMIRALNKLHFDVPDWIPGMGGKSFGFNLNELAHVSIPKLAQGAVLPPNKEFLAVLGDQNQGTNVEAPLDTIKQALLEALTEVKGVNMGDSKSPIILQLNGHDIAKAVWDENEKRYKQTGKYSPVYGG